MEGKTSWQRLHKRVNLVLLILGVGWVWYGQPTIKWMQRKVGTFTSGHVQWRYTHSPFPRALRWVCLSTQILSKQNTHSYSMVEQQYTADYTYIHVQNSGGQPQMHCVPKKPTPAWPVSKRWCVLLQVGLHFHVWIFQTENVLELTRDS